MIFVAKFERGINTTTQQPQWQYWTDYANPVRRTLYTPHTEGKLPTSPNEIWVCQQWDMIAPGDQKGHPTIHSVKLVQKLCDDEELRLNFQQDPVRFIDGTLAMYAMRQPAQWDLHVSELRCVPDRRSKFKPTPASPFWFCRALKPLGHIGQFGSLVVAVELLREDLENKAAYEAAKQEEASRFEAERLEQERQQAERDEAARVYLARRSVLAGSVFAADTTPKKRLKGGY